MIGWYIAAGILGLILLLLLLPVAGMFSFDSLKFIFRSAEPFRRFYPNIK